VTTKELYKGVSFFDRGINFSNCPGIDLILQAKEDRLYVACKFVDIKSSHKIGEMEFNHWKIFNDEISEYYCNDESFEVIDKQGYVVFSIS
jgi:hypothetical protein